MGFDVHRLVADRELWLCGVRIPHSLGLLGHSDADVATHALCDALLGAAGLRDIGFYFPDTDPAFKGANSIGLLRSVVKILADEGWSMGNVDITICAERPKINPHIPQMRSIIAEALTVEESAVGIKATTTERLGFTGREEGIAAYAVALIAR